MILEIQAEIQGNLTIRKDFSFRHHPYTVAINQVSDKFYITFSRKVNDKIAEIPKMQNGNDGIPHICLPREDAYQDIIEILQHVESFGALDDRLSKIDMENLKFKWIPENENDHQSPFNELSRKLEEKEKTELTEGWLRDTIIHQRQMRNLYLPFSFFRDGKEFFNMRKYQASYCSFYMMLEFFFNENGWGIKNDAHTRKVCLNGALSKTLEQMPKYIEHYNWLILELKNRQKSYNVEGLLFLLNRFRDEFSHASQNERNRNPFRERDYISISFIIMVVCNFVSIKMRLLPFVREDERDSFLRR